SGKIFTNGNTFTLGADAVTDVSTTSTRTSYVVGSLNKVIRAGGNFFFPVGNENFYMPVAVNGATYSVNTPLTWTASYSEGNSHEGTTNDDPLIVRISN